MAPTELAWAALLRLLQFGWLLAGRHVGVDRGLRGGGLRAERSQQVELEKGRLLTVGYCRWVWGGVCLISACRSGAECAAACWLLLCWGGLLVADGQGVLRRGQDINLQLGLCSVSLWLKSS